MLSWATMDPATRLELLRTVPIDPTDDPLLLEQREDILNYLLQDPKLRDRVVRQQREAAAREDARRSLRAVLSARSLPRMAEQEARIDAQQDIEVLHRWITQAATAASADEALA